MNKYRLALNIEDEVTEENVYEAWQTFRNRVIERYYGPIDTQVELIEEIPPEGEIPE